MTMDAATEGGIPNIEGMYDIYAIDFHDPSLYLCALGIFIAGIFASASGIGGGGIFVAVLMLVGDLSPHQAVPLSKALIFSGSIMSFLVNVQKVDEHGRSLIQSHVVKNVVPMALGGTLLGVMLNCYMPRAILVLCLALLLTVMSCKLLRQAYTTYSQENSTIESCTNSNYYYRDDEEDTKTPGTMASSTDRDNLQLEVGRKRDSQEEMRDMTSAFSPRVSGGPELEDSDHDSAVGLDGREVHRFREATPATLVPSKWAVFSQVPSQDVMTLIIMLGCVIACGSLRSAFPEKEMLWPNIILSIGLVVCISVASYFWRKTKIIQQRHIDPENAVTLKYPLISFFTGICSGLMGIGGGLIFAPFFLMSGMDPTKAVVTSATCVIFTATSTTFQYLFLGRVMIYEAIIFGIVSFCASICGTMLIHWVKAATGRSSPVVLLVAVTVFVSCALLMLKGIRFAQEDWFPHELAPIAPVASPQQALYEIATNTTSSPDPIAMSDAVIQKLVSSTQKP